jgi:hypothetical protein
VAFLFSLFVSSTLSSLLLTSVQHKQLHSFSSAFLSHALRRHILLSTYAFQASFSFFKSYLNFLGRFFPDVSSTINMSVVSFYHSGKGTSNMPRKFMLLTIVLAVSSAVLVSSQETSDENDVASLMEGATPAGVDDALLDSDQAAESLAAEFASTTPAWFQSLPASVTNYYNEISTPALMDVSANTESLGAAAARVTSGLIKTEPWVSLSSVASELSVSAVSLSMRATSAGHAAYIMSQQVASGDATNTLQWAEAYQMSKAATSLGQYAARESDLASQISQGVVDSRFSGGSTMSEVPRLTTVSLLIGAVAALGFAVLL